MNVYTPTPTPRKEYEAMQQEVLDQTLTEALKSAPPVAITGAAWIGGLTINELVGIVTLVYLAAQIGLLVPKYWRLYAGWRGKPKK